MGISAVLGRVLLVGLLAAGVSACAASGSAPITLAPKAAHFAFDGAAPISDAGDFAPWAALAANNAAGDRVIEACLADKKACTSPGLLRFRRMMELAAELPRGQQLGLVHAFFNTATWIAEKPDVSRETWAPFYQVVSTLKTDCKGVAFGKYFALRRLGWAAKDLRVVMGWDAEQRDWHAVLAVRDGRETYMLDSILGLQRPADFAVMRMVYSVSELGIWDHAPDYMPRGMP